MKNKNFFYSSYSNGEEKTSELTFKRNFLLGIILCLAGISVGIYAFHIGLLSLWGIAIFLAANALFLAGVFQLLGVAEITCPVCGKMTGVSRLQKECKCRSCRNKIKITKKED